MTAQLVNGDPFLDGGNINLVTNQFVTLDFDEIDKLLHDPVPGETITVDGVSGLTYEFLGYGDVRNDPLQSAAFIRVLNPDGTYTTLAIDMNADGDATPNLTSGNTKLTVANLTSGPGEPFPSPACFTPGTLVETDRGLRLIETLVVGDMVRTRDHGLQALRWIGSQEVTASGAFAPVEFAPGAIGNSVSLIVSQHHRMLVTGWRAELIAGEDEVFVPAKFLVNGRDIRLREGGRVSYIHMLLDQHDVVKAGGVWSESYFPGHAVGQEDAGLRDEIMHLFPELFANSVPHFVARPVLRGFEAACLVA
ncbi:Hint domain-containing protein [Primorskyibacter aestuariivivens]|uniref:Hint domain-containing protein n=1 Tax=Primorskyibacter aestuariivivens TaxID=1888912 RepID=UPI0023015DEF|nr:Hint domain-containing protein [Primorskyibacter aestuariivivens]MDA7429518.1 Hint domain-containing protein [Primorskyibacter aestuariivivens]